MKKINIILVLLLFGLVSSAQTKKVLFVGNSYTYFNDLPNTLKAIALDAGDSVDVATHTAGGARISQHANSAELYDKIRTTVWDYVVIQCQSQEPSFPDGQVATQVFPHAKRICDSIRANNSCTIPLFFMTWGRKNGDASNCSVWPPICTYEGMDSILRSNYIKMGLNNQAEVCPVGVVWNTLINNGTAIELYNPDESHPAREGTVAAAYTFYATIFRKSAQSSSFKYTLPQYQIDSIRNAVDAVMEGNWDTYNIGVNDPDPSFTQAMNSCTVSVQANNDFDNYHWDFGDGFDTIAGKNYVHQYASSGTYTVKLSVSECSQSSVDSVVVGCDRTVGVSAIQEENLKVYPNPTQGKVILPNGWQLLEITTSLGSEVPFEQRSSNEIQIIGNMPQVLYLFLQNSNDSIAVKKVLVQ